MMSGPHGEERSPLSLRLEAYYQEVVRLHANQGDTSVCGICQVARCEDWRFATERLICGGNLPQLGALADGNEDDEAHGNPNASDSADNVAG